MRFILTLILSTLSAVVLAQNSNAEKEKNDITLLQHFIAELADSDIAVDIILSQYIVVEEPSDDIYDYLEVSLEEIRINLMTKKIEEISYIPYHKVPKKEIKDIDLTDLNTNDIYFLFYKNKQMLALYLEDGKIASFTLVAKGNGKAHFVLY